MRNETFLIRMAYEEDWDEAMLLCWRTFLKYEAADYSQEGIDNFRNFITDMTLKKMFCQGSYQMFVATYDNKLVGVVSLRNSSHISLLFVEETFHRKGIGTDLLNHLFYYLASEMNIDKITVNAAPYAVDFYHKIGFTDQGPETTSDGIRYTPMEFFL